MAVFMQNNTKLDELINNLPKGQDKPLPNQPLPIPDISYLEKKYSISWLEMHWFGAKPIVRGVISLAAIFIPQVKAVDILWNIVEPENKQSIQGDTSMADTPVVGKKWYASKTLWVNVISIIGVVVFNDTLSAETSVLILGVINTILRVITKEQIVW
jgi:hypothetical protein